MIGLVIYDPLIRALKWIMEQLSIPPPVAVQI